MEEKEKTEEVCCHQGGVNVYKALDNRAYPFYVAICSLCGKKSEAKKTEKQAVQDLEKE